MIESLAPSAFDALEASFGVQPLAEAFFEEKDAVARGSLGLFTPTPEMTWESAAFAGERSDHAVLLRGEARIPNPRADGAIVLVRLDTGYRLARVETGLPEAGRLRLDGHTVSPGHLSKPVTFEPGSVFLRCLEAYAGAWALSASLHAADEVRALRRAARTTRHGDKAFSSSQWVSLEITEVEIETELTGLAARDGEGGFAAAAAAARTLHAVATKTVELRDQAGLEIEGNPLRTAQALTAFLGGPLRIESEIARSLGIQVVEGMPAMAVAG